MHPARTTAEPGATRGEDRQSARKPDLARNDAYSYDPLSRLINDGQTGTGYVTSTLNYVHNSEIHSVTTGNIIDNGTY